VTQAVSGGLGAGHPGSEGRSRKKGEYARAAPGSRAAGDGAARLFGAPGVRARWPESPDVPAANAT
jgi:hypothetical protein